VNGDIWVLAEYKGQEIKDVTLEILGEARKLAGQSGDKVAALLVGNQIPDMSEPLAQYGADIVYRIEHPALENFSTDGYIDALSSFIRKYDPSIFICGATALGRALAPGLAARLQTGLVTNCTILKYNAQNILEMTRDTYRGRIYETRTCISSARPQMATIKPGVIGLGKPNKARNAEVVQENIELAEGVVRTRSLGIIKADPGTVDVSEADIVVAAGKGVGQSGAFSMVQELADLLYASIGGSRPAVDAGWIPYGRQIGQTGKTVSPKLYISCGISGVTQHSMGMKDSNLIIAVNTDRAAPLFKLADVGILADLHELLPALIKEVKQVKQEEQGDK